jgi:hypothetical protein
MTGLFDVDDVARITRGVNANARRRLHHPVSVAAQSGR